MLLTFDCDGATLAAAAHPGDRDTAVLIVTGGVQTRVGSHRGFVDLARRLSDDGFASLRFDRRGVGDSDGDDPGYRGSGPDIAAAAAALRAAFPHVRRVVGWGLCDGASALALHGRAAGLDALILANPWTLDTDRAGPLPPRAAIASRYADRLQNPHEWLRLLRGGVNLKRATQGLLRLASPSPPTQLLSDTARALAAFPGPILVVLGDADATAQAFGAAWATAPFHSVRARAMLARVPGATHTFTRPADADALATLCLDWLRGLD